MYNTQIIRMTINGVEEEVTVKPYATLLDVMRDQMGHIEVKEGCAVGDCGACAVFLNGEAICACLALARQADGAEIITAAGLGTPDNLHPLQQAYMDYGGIQCGFCTPGLVIASKALLDQTPHPTRQEVKIALSGNFCRCTGYEQVIEAVLGAAEMMDGHNG